MDAAHRFYLDASVPVAVARALDLVRGDIEYPGKPGCPIITPAVHDDVWLPIIGQQGWAAILRDSHIRTRPREIRAILEHGVRAFVMTHAGRYTRWQTLELLVRCWQGIEHAAQKPGPVVFSVTQSGVRRLAPLPG